MAPVTRARARRMREEAPIKEEVKKVKEEVAPVVIKEEVAAIIKEEVAPTTIKEEVAPTTIKEEAAPAVIKEEVAPPTIKEEVASAVIKEEVAPPIVKEEVRDGPTPAELLIHFRSLEKPKEDDFCLELSKLSTYDDVVERVAQQIGLDDPSKVRLTAHNWYLEEPKWYSIKYRSARHLSDMLFFYNKISEILYYEVLDITFPELELLRTLKVAFHQATKDEVVIHSIQLPKKLTVGDLLNELKTKVELSHPSAELRMLMIWDRKIHSIVSTTEKLEKMCDEYWKLRVEEIPEEEKNLGPNDRLIQCYHYAKNVDPYPLVDKHFGDPFILVIRERETLWEVKLGIKKKFQLSNEEFSKWEFVLRLGYRQHGLDDSDIVSYQLRRIGVRGFWEQHIGLQQPYQNRHAYEKPVKIYNSGRIFGARKH